MPTLTITPQTREAHGKPYAFVPLAGSLDARQLEEIAKQLEPLLESEHTYLVIDLGEVDLVSSHAMSYLENLHRKAKAVEKQVAFVNANEELREILEFIGLAKSIVTFDEEEKFLEALGREEI